MSYQIGRAEGFVYSDLKLNGVHHSEKASLFPVTLQSKVFVRSYFRGILDGIIKGGSLSLLFKRSIHHMIQPRAALLGTTIFLIDKLSQHPTLMNLCRNERFSSELCSIPHRIPSAYSMNDAEVSYLFKNVILYEFRRLVKSQTVDQPRYPTLWIFSDINNYQLVLPLNLLLS